MRLRGEIRLFYQSECVRCLRPVEEEVTIPVDEEIYPLGYQADLHKRFALGEPDAEQEEELTDPEELLFHDKKKLEIAKLLQDQALLALPIGVYCDSACPGLCPSCGRRRDDPQCHCEDVADNNSPFDKLRELL